MACCVWWCGAQPEPIPRERERQRSPLCWMIRQVCGCCCFGFGPPSARALGHHYSFDRAQKKNKQKCATCVSLCRSLDINFRLYFFLPLLPWTPTSGIVQFFRLCLGGRPSIKEKPKHALRCNTQTHTHRHVPSKTERSKAASPGSERDRRKASRLTSPATAAASPTKPRQQE